MPESFKCFLCDRTFATERGRDVHYFRWCPLNACPLCGYFGRPYGCQDHFL